MTLEDRLAKLEAQVRDLQGQLAALRRHVRMSAPQPAPARPGMFKEITDCTSNDEILYFDEQGGSRLIKAGEPIPVRKADL